MKAITKNLWVFMLITTIVTLIFLNLLYKAISAEEYNLIFIYCPIYSILLFFSALLLGKNDSTRKQRNDLGFQYHLASYIIINLLNVLWVFTTIGFGNDEITMVLFQLLVWAIILLIHYYFSRKTLKGYSKKSIF